MAIIQFNESERLVLRCIVMGQKRDLTCTRTGMVGRTYDRHRSSIMRKCDCQTDVDLVWKALRCGWVSLSATSEIKLNESERLVLRCIVMGQKRDLTCTGTGMAGSTYNRHRSSIMRKCNCQTDVDLVWKALRCGWVSLSATSEITWHGGV